VDPRFYDTNHPEYDPYDPRNIDNEIYEA